MHNEPWIHTPDSYQISNGSVSLNWYKMSQVFQSDQIQRSSRKIFAAPYACSHADLNLTLVMGMTNWFIFQVINLLMETWGYAWPALTVKGCSCSRQKWIQRAIFFHPSENFKETPNIARLRKLSFSLLPSTWDVSPGEKSVPQRFPYWQC